MRQVVFNVGGALSTYIEFADKKVLIDVGASNEFNPVEDFLLPVFKRRNDEKNGDKFILDQCIISHPHKDHISAIESLGKYFYMSLLTCPNSNNGMDSRDIINWDLVGNEDDPSIIELRKLLEGRSPPLKSSDQTSLFINYLHPKEVEADEELTGESYVNNISIATVIRSCGYTILCPGDLQKAGMARLIKNDSFFRNKLTDGVDVLIAPHHGLRSSFSVDLFGKMKSGKTRCLNIVSEKENTDDAREVDSRYSTDEYCKGENSLSTAGEPHYQVRTSRGHVLLEYGAGGKVNVKIINNSKELIEAWLS